MGGLRQAGLDFTPLFLYLSPKRGLTGLCRHVWGKLVVKTTFLLMGSFICQRKHPKYLKIFKDKFQIQALVTLTCVKLVWTCSDIHNPLVFS